MILLQASTVAEHRGSIRNGCRSVDQGGPMSISVRHVEERDATGVQQILVSEHVVQGTMRLPYSGFEYAAQRIKPHEGEYKLVATSGESVVGYCELATHPNQPRRRHAGEINL